MYKRKNHLRSEWQRQALAGLVGTAGFGLLLVFRVLFLGSAQYVFMLKNLGLAWLAWIAGVMLLSVGRRRFGWVVAIILGLAWFAMLPNTFYVVTDFVHVVFGYERVDVFRGEDFALITDIVPAMIDIALMSAAAWTAGLLGALSLDDVRLKVAKVWGGGVAFLLTKVVLLSSAYGIYLGRSPRLNSWHVLTDPSFTYKTITQSFTNSGERTIMLQVTLSYFVLISLCFWSVCLIKRSRL
jgi:uncharacterized membrane protein